MKRLEEPNLHNRIRANKKTMNIEQLREHCLSVKGVSETQSFGDDMLVYKVMSKVFCFFSLNPKDGEHFALMKCNPEKSTELREKYEGVTKAYQKGDNDLTWNSVYIQKDVPDALIKQLIDHSAEEVIKKLSKKKQQEYYESIQ